MKEKYRDMYKQLVHAYYNRNFEEVFEHLMANEFQNNEETNKLEKLVVILRSIW